MAIDRSRPRLGPHWDDPGAYDQAIRILDPVIDPGDEVRLEHYFVGYGTIRAAKVVFYPSDALFEKTRSRVAHSLDKAANGNGFRWGAIEHPVDENGFTLSLQGARHPDWDAQEPSTMFLDLTPDRVSVPMLTTETKIDGNAPISYYLATRADAKPGRYSLEFTFVYNDGKSWKSSSKKIEITVRNFLERHAILIGKFALFASTLSVAKILLWPFLKAWIASTWPSIGQWIATYG